MNPTRFVRCPTSGETWELLNLLLLLEGLEEGLEVPYFTVTVTDAFVLHESNTFCALPRLRLYLPARLPHAAAAGAPCSR